MERKKNKTDVENTRPMSAGESKIIFQKLTPTILSRTSEELC